MPAGRYAAREVARNNIRKERQAEVQVRVRERRQRRRTEGLSADPPLDEVDDEEWAEHRFKSPPEYMWKVGV